jgi:quercetin dioxygenase-like cupin family protein
MTRARTWFAFCICAISLPTTALRAQVVQLLDNDSVRVFRATIRAGTSTGPHTHSLPHATYVEKGGTLVIRRPDGTSDTVKAATGSAYWGKVETHTADNIGPSDVVLITVELKRPQARQSPN